MGAGMLGGYKMNTINKIINQIKISNNNRFFATNKNTGKKYRCFIESDSYIFVFAHKSRRKGYRYRCNDFINNFEITPIPNKNLQWKKRLKRAINICTGSGLWVDLVEVWKNLYKYVTLEEKENIANLYWNDRNAAIEYCKKNYAFMCYKNEEKKDCLHFDYINELSNCELKAMYFGYANATEKEAIKKAIAERKKYTTPRIRANYDISFNYNPETNKAWYNEEYRNCGNGHYYIALDHNTAAFYEDD